MELEFSRAYVASLLHLLLLSGNLLFGILCLGYSNWILGEEGEEEICCSFSYSVAWWPVCLGGGPSERSAWILANLIQTQPHEGDSKFLQCVFSVTLLWVLVLAVVLPISTTLELPPNIDNKIPPV
jgi:hypothetical protein